MEQMTIQSYFKDTFIKYKNKTAIEEGDNCLTYDELNNRSSVIASHILAKGYGDGSHIAVLQENRTNIICTLIGILKANCVFVPLDCNYPLERIEKMAEYADIEVLITDDSISDEITQRFCEKGVTILNFASLIHYSGKSKENIVNAVIYSPDDKIYIYYSSGTTGIPKAIIGKNKSLLHYILWEKSTFNITQNCRVSQFTSSSHDPFLRDVFVPLLAGGTICIPSGGREQILSPAHLAGWINKSGISLIHCTPSLFKVFSSAILDSKDFSCLEYIFLAGEKVVPFILEEWYKQFQNRIQLVNLYGPTETTLAKFYYLIKLEDVNRQSIPVGKPIDGCKAIILNSDMKICNFGETGEIYIRTPYMTLGYYKNEKLTSECFIQNPFTDKKDIIYRTGDYGRVLSTGDIEFMGRKDRQIKIRGFRVELEEIEKAMSKFEGMKECLAYYKEGRDSRITERCTICGIPANYPNIELDNKGVCSSCQSYEQNKSSICSYFGEEEELKNILKYRKDKSIGEYDCILLYSGGKDSTYALCRLVKMGVKVLSYTFDNGYISQTALQNIKNVLKELNVTYVIDTFTKMKQTFLDGIKEELSVCNGCFRILRTKSTKLAYERGIPYIVTGFSRGQIFDLRLESIYKMNLFGKDEIEEKIYEQRLMYHSQNDYITHNLDNEERVDEKMLKEVQLIDFYRYSEIKKEDIINYIKQNCKSWSKPEDTGFCSSNCRINDVGIYLQKRAYGYDNYTSPNCWEVRLKHIEKSDAKEELESNVDVGKVKEILEEIGCDEMDLSLNLDDSYITLYYTSENKIKESDLRSDVEQKLPNYMIPSYFVHLEKLPISVNGKIDYSALIDPQKVVETDFKEAETRTQQKVVEIFQRILGAGAIGIEASFLKSGGNSLNVMALIAQIYQSFEVEISLGEVFADSTVKGIANYIDNANKNKYVPITMAERKDYYPLSSAQLRIYLSEEMNKTNPTIYNTVTVMEIRGMLNIQKLENAIRQLIDGNETLRTSFKIMNGQPVQHIHDAVNFTLECTDVGEDIDLNSEVGRKRLDDFIEQFIKTFDISKAPLFHAAILKSSEEKNFLLYDIHHIISDATSNTILANELIQLYSDKKLEKQIQYKDYSEWQNMMFERDSYKKQKDYWLSLFKGELPSLDLKTDYERTLVSNFEGRCVSIDLEEKLSQQLRDLAAETNCTMFMIFLAAYNILLWKYSGKEDIIVGTPTQGRNYVELENIIGIFINTIALRNQPKGDKFFLDFLYEIKKKTLIAFENQEYQFEHLVEATELNRRPGHNPLFDVMIIYQNMEKPKLQSDNMDFIKYRYRNKISKYDFTLIIENENNSYSIFIEYCSKLYKEDTIHKMLEDYVVILTEITKKQNINLYDISLTNDLSMLEEIPTEITFNI